MAGGRREGIWKLGTFMGGYRELSILRIDWPSHRFRGVPEGEPPELPVSSSFPGIVSSVSCICALSG